MSYVYSPPTAASFTGKGLVGYSFGPLRQEDMEVYYIESEKGHDVFVVSKKITRFWYVSLRGRGPFHHRQPKIRCWSRHACGSTSKSRILLFGEDDSFGVRQALAGSAGMILHKMESGCSGRRFSLQTGQSKTSVNTSRCIEGLRKISFKCLLTAQSAIVAPFTRFPDLIRSRRLIRVTSCSDWPRYNVSGHKLSALTFSAIGPSWN